MSPNPKSRFIRLPKSLLARMLLTLALGMLVTQAIFTWLWGLQVEQQARKDTEQAAQYLGHAASATALYFALLPQNYQALVIDQLREMGGTRFFVTLNQQAISQPSLQHPLAQLAEQTFAHTLSEQLGSGFAFTSHLVWPDQLLTSSQGHPITELPRQWTEYSLLLQPQPAPLMLAQVELAPDQWLFIAGLMPDPYFLDKAQLFQAWGWLVVLPMVVALVLVVPLVRSVTRPLAKLAEATHRFGRGLSHAPLPSHGSREYLQLRDAILGMEARIERFIQDRSRLFSAISHDLRTPITRLKLRTEFLDDAQTQQDFNQDLDDLTRLVSTALQSVKETALDEELACIELDKMLKQLVKTYNYRQPLIQLDCPELIMCTKIMAFKRILDNLVSNGLHYGQRLRIQVQNQEPWVVILIHDQGPGVPEQALAQLIQPGYRLQHGRQQNDQGQGLGLSISHNLCLGLGGSLRLYNHPEGGLVAEVRLPSHPDAQT